MSSTANCRLCYATVFVHFMGVSLDEKSTFSNVNLERVLQAFSQVRQRWVTWVNA